MRLRIICITLATICSLNLFSQRFSIRAHLDTNKIKLGEQTYLHLQVIQAKDSRILFPAIADTLTKNVEVARQSPIDTVFGTGKNIKVRQKLLITSFEKGVQIIPPLKFLLQNGNRIDTLKSNALHLQVISYEIPDTAKTINDINPPINTPFNLKEFLQRFYPYIIVGCLAILVLILSIYFYRKKKQNKPLIKISKPKQPPHVIAFDKLEKLKKKKLWQKDKFKEYYSELTEIIRQYIEDRFSLPAMESTSDEILTMFQDKKLLEHESFENLQKMLLLADLVKFAKHRPLPDENENSYTYAYDVVKTTIYAKIDENRDKPIGELADEKEKRALTEKQNQQTNNVQQSGNEKKPEEESK